MIAARGARIQAVNTVFPKRARGSEHVVADMRRHLDVVEDGKVGDGLETGAARIVHDQLQRGLLENITRYRMAAVVAVLFTQDGGILLQQPGRALDGCDLSAFNVELDQIFRGWRKPAVLNQGVEWDNRRFLPVGAAPGN